MFPFHVPNQVIVFSSQTRYMVPATTSSITSGYTNGNSISDNSRSIYGPNAVVVNANTTIDSIQERLSALEIEKNKKIDALDNK